MKINTDKPFTVTESNLDEIDTQLRRQSRSLFGLGDPKVGVMRDKRCPVCGSFFIWKHFSGWNKNGDGHNIHSVGMRALCPSCQECTVGDPHVPDNDAPAIEVEPYNAEWVQCPGCGWKFKFRDSTYFRDGRHRKCGQRLTIKDI